MDALLNKQKFESLFYGAETPMVIFKGEDLVVEMFNQSYHDIYHQHDILGKPLFDSITELRDTQFPNILKNVFETGKTHVSHEGHARILNRKTGEIEDRYFDTTFSRIFWEEDKVYRILAMPREVTEKVKFRKQLEASLTKLEEEKVFRDFFMSALSHDLRSPLSIIKVCVEIIQKRPDRVEDVLRLSQKMMANVERSQRMIGDLLDVNRIQEGLWPDLHPYPVSLKEIVEESILGLNNLYEDRIITQINAQDSVGNWDRTAISRILDNLVSNAAKYGDKDSLITVSLSYKNKCFLLSVHNWGNPISEDEQGYIFTKHRRGTYALSSGQKGWGVGLAVVKGLVMSHSGKISVKSSEEEGTTFTVELPDTIIG